MLRAAFRLVAVPCVALAAAQRGVSASAVPGSSEAKSNWQDGWRASLDDCERQKRPMFIGAKGKLVSRRVGDMAGLLAKHVASEKSKEGEARERQRRRAAAPKKKGQKLSKKERMKLELTSQLGGAFGDFEAGLPQQEDEEAKQLRQTADNMMLQMMSRAKLKPETMVTLREFCDLVWRTGNASPLDPDEAVAAEPGLPDPGDDEDAPRVELEGDATDEL